MTVTSTPPSNGRGESSTAVERAADILTLFGQGSRTLGITEISQQLGLSKAVVYRVLNAFRDRGFVELDEVTHRYSLGPQLLLIGLAALEQIDVRILAREAMQRLSDATQETATLSIRMGWSRIYVDQVTPDRDIKMVVPVGHAYPLHSGASSKALLAFLAPAERDEYLARPLEAVTDATETDSDALRRELDVIRSRGYATSEGERQVGAGAVAAPIMGMDGLPAATMSVCGPIERFHPQLDSLAEQLLAETRSISRRMGYTGS